MKAATSPSPRCSSIEKSSACAADCSRRRLAQTAAAGAQAARPAHDSQGPARDDRPWDKVEDERFHLNCVVAQVWLLQLRRYTETRYGETPAAQRPVLQTGYARRSFFTLFEPPNAIEAVRLFENLLRFANYESAAPARTFFLAYAPLAFEHDASGEYIGPGVWSPDAGSKIAAARVRRTLQRWCDWLEALMHFQIHELHGQGQFALARELDQALILLWPLLLRHKWNASDLLAVLRSLLNGGAGFPCQSAEQLTSYCRSALALRLPNRRSAVQNRMLAGQEVADRVFRFLPTIG